MPLPLAIFGLEADRVETTERILPATPALEVEQVSKRYQRLSLRLLRGRAPTGPYALRDVSAAVGQGETLGLLGANGAGKTSLLKIISTLSTPSSGRVRLFGRDIGRHAKWARQNIGLVTCDERSFYWRLSGRRNLQFFGTLYGLTPEVIEKRSDRLFETLNLTAAADRPYQEYSSGMKQKLAIARGLIAQPRLVLYDEPTRSLDPVSTRTIRRWIREWRVIAPWQTHIIATNQLDEAEELCDRVLILGGGRIAAFGSIAEIRARVRRDGIESHRITYRGPDVLAVARAVAPDGLVEISAGSDTGESRVVVARVVPESAALSRLLQIILEGGGVVVRCEAERVSFNEAFFSLAAQPGFSPTMEEVMP
jgi:ABC-2 type transport system ATP-binding protein